MSKTLLVALALAIVPFTFAGTVSADWSCGPVLDSCGGDTNADNPYAGCDGTWRDVMAQGTYAQICVDSGAHVWVCPNSFSYDVNNAACVPVSS